MTKLKATLLFLSFTISIFSFGQKDSLQKETALDWQTDIMKANEISKATNKPIFALFTGSDWCFWCKKLQANVLSKPEFAQWAKKNVVLLELDFPRSKTLSPELAQQNANLQQTFGVRGYPTIWMFSLTKDPKDAKMNIEALGSLGYPQDPEPGKEEIKFLSDANSILARKTAK